MSIPDCVTNPLWPIAAREEMKNYASRGNRFRRLDLNQPAANAGGVQWHEIATNKPPEKSLLMLSGPSHSNIHPKFLALGYHEEKFRPRFDGKIRWLDQHGDPFSDLGYEPEHWAFPMELP